MSGENERAWRRLLNELLEKISADETLSEALSGLTENSSIEEVRRALEEAGEEALLASVSEEKLLELSEEMAKQDYHSLVKELGELVSGYEVYNDTVSSSAGSLLESLNSLEEEIESYERLRQELLGAADAFAALDEAAEKDSAADYTDDLASLIQSFIESCTSGEFGTETMAAALEGLIPESVYEGLYSAGDKISAGWDYLSGLMEKGYFSFSEKSGVSIDFENIQAFVQDALNTAYGTGTVLEGSLEGFTLNEGIDSLEKFAGAMNITQAAAYALGTAISKYSASGADFLSALMPDTLENRIYSAEEELKALIEERDALLKGGEFSAAGWEELTQQILEQEALLSELSGEASEAVYEYSLAAGEAQEAETRVTELYETLSKMAETDPEYTIVFSDYAQAEEELLRLTQTLNELEEPTELTITLALEDLQARIDEIYAEVAEFNSETGTYEIKTGVSRSEYDEAMAELGELQEQYGVIEAYAEIDDTDLLKSLETIEEFEFSGKKVTVSLNGYETVKERLLIIADLLEALSDGEISLSTDIITRIASAEEPDAVSSAQPQYAAGTAYIKGTASASGNWGIKKTEENALVGELGRELVVDPDSGTYRTVGDKGAEIVKLKRGSIVFNHLQTAEILKNRRGGGRAFASGSTSFQFITDTVYTAASEGLYRTSSSSSSSSSAASSESVEEKIEELSAALEDLTGNFQHEIYMMERAGASAGELTARYKAMQDTLHDYAEEYRSLGLSEDSDYIQELSEEWWELQDEIESIKEETLAGLADMVEEASDALKGLTSAYSVLKGAAEEYASNGGFISTDTFREIIELGPEYLSLLTDENGLLKLNEERINAALQAQTENLAVESALSYVERLRLAALGESGESLEELLGITQETSEATWELVYAQLSLIDLTDEEYSQAVSNIEAIRALAETAIAGVGQTADAASDSLSDMQSALYDILDYTMDMLEDETQLQIDALEEMKDAYSEIISLKLKSLQQSADEADYEEEIADKIQEISALTAEIEALSLDDSREAQAEKKALIEELSELQEDLYDLQAEHLLEAQEDALYDMEEAYIDEKDAEIQALEESVSSYEKLYDMAISYISENWESLYDELISWNYEYGSALSEEISGAWEKALQAAEEYGDFVSALNGTGESDDEAADSLTVASSSSDDEAVHRIIYTMYQNSVSWASASDSEKEALSQENLSLGAGLSAYGITAVRDAAGVWHIDSEDGELLFSKYASYTTYHTGGVVGGDDEELALLKKGEWVLNEEMVESLKEALALLSSASGAASDGPGADAFIERVPESGTRSGGDTYSSSSSAVNITIGDTVINCSRSEGTVSDYQEVTREMVSKIARILGVKD